MLIKREKPAFSPVVITLETQRELDDVATVLYFSALRKGGLHEMLVSSLKSEGASIKKVDTSSNVVLEILEERRRQIYEEGFGEKHDDAYAESELERAAACYVQSTWDGPSMQMPWPWGAKWWKPINPRRSLIKAAALIIAAIESMDRKMAQHG